MVKWIGQGMNEVATDPQCEFTKDKMSSNEQKKQINNKIQHKDEEWKLTYYTDPPELHPKNKSNIPEAQCGSVPARHVS
ncbi:hypothetical protein Hanom_Chr01g00048811 [Helianthus anomalus]